MRRWDGLVDRYLMECETRGLASATLSHRRRELERFGSWIRRCRPKPRLEEIAAEHIASYVSSRSAFRARSSVAGAISHVRGMGDFLVRAGIWPVSPLRWMRGPKIDSHAMIPRRVSRSQMDALWSAATRRPTE